MIDRVARLSKRLALGRPDVSDPLQLVHARPLDRPVIFCTRMENDPIQRNHRKGRFYEQDELRRLIGLMPAGGCFVDIGANVGNHSLFAALHLGAGRVIPFEPNVLAYDLLIQNVLVNRLADVVTLDHLGFGLSDRPSDGFGMAEKARNLGSARMLEGAGDLEMRTGDAMLADVLPHFIKIDVEGMEIAVLSGLEDTIRRARPVMQIEVDTDNDAAFAGWLAAQEYTVLHEDSRYKANRNFLVCPSDRAAELTRTLAQEDSA
ncbi:FkbM family methyltransferase [Pseudooceanicola aestuarii]|uniref:FkbM family methyltransferase n=1 Tax=Pseudooceanicola aestuarii TaxID=2697319 RepID=UPI0013D58EAE|nr:FkbM family methyltransferase [Pseudooceanicola aestuarii]